MLNQPTSIVTSKLTSRRLASIVAMSLSSITLISFFSLTLNSANAVNPVDNIAINVPDSACSLASTVDSTHTSNIYNGTYEEEIGTTTLRAFCNDTDGFSIYAIGYTNDEEGNNNLAGSITRQNITTGLANSGSTSAWSMKLTKETDSNLSYNPNNLIINNSFDSYHTIPATYTKVATNTSATDNTLGSSIKATYAVYISPLQLADSYNGKVKYILMRTNDNTNTPDNPDNPDTPETPAEPKTVTVNYHGNGATFENGSTTNTVVYTSTPMYVATTPTIVKTTNLDNDGNKINNAGYDMTGCNIVSIEPDGTKTNGMATSMEGRKVMLNNLTVSGAEKLVVEIDYSIGEDEEDGGLAIIEGNYSIFSGGAPTGYFEVIAGQKQGTITQVINGNAVTIYMVHEEGRVLSSDYNYGVYAKVYPVYSTATEGAVASDKHYNVPNVSTGNYATPRASYGYWQADINEEHYEFSDEEEIIDFIDSNLDDFDGAEINLYYETEGEIDCVSTLPSGTGIMQTWTKPNNLADYCDGASTTLTDNRSGNKSYTVAKIGELVWMTKNLDLSGGTTLTSGDSNVISDYTLPTSSTSGFSDNTIAYVYNSDSTICDNGQPCYSYYSYAAATAGANPYSGDATSDICPKGWRLPLQIEYIDLQYTYTLIGSPFFGAYSGYYRDGSVNKGGLSGYYYSSQADLGNFAYSLIFDSSSSSIGHLTKNNGFAVRCVAK